MYLKYQSEFYSQNKDSSTDSRWRLNIYKKTGTGSTIDFKCTSEGFTLNMDGGNDSMLSPMKTTSVSFNFIIEGAAQEAIIDDILSLATDNEGELALLIERYDATNGWRRWWIGAVLGDLAALDDKGINRVITIKAVDGLTQLKYKTFNQSDDGGVRSLIYLIKNALNLITCNHTDFNFWDNSDADKKYFLATMPFYYCRAMNDGGSYSSNLIDNTWKRNVNHDPLALLKLNTIVFNNPDGTTWSYYKILEQILASMQLRIMMTPLGDLTGSSGPSTITDGNCIWFIEAPLNYHGTTDDSDRDLTQLLMYHNNSTTSDIAIEYDKWFTLFEMNPTQRLSGGKEAFIPSLYSFKSIYNHNILACELGSGQTGVAQSYSSAQGGNWDPYANFGIGGEDNASHLTGRIDVAAPGWPGNLGQAAAQGKQKLIITGEITLNPIDTLYYSSGIGYESGEEFWTAQGEEWPIATYYDWALDEDIIMPRLGVMLTTTWQDQTAGESKNSQIYLGDERFSILTGGVPWNKQTLASSTIDVQATTTDQFNDNYAGYDGTFLGLKYDMSNPGTTTYQDDDGLVLWGTDIGESNYYWWCDQDNTLDVNSLFVWQSQYANSFAFISPIYHQVNTAILSPGSSWDSSWWEATLPSRSVTNRFSIETPGIPWTKGPLDTTYGTCRLGNVRLFFASGRDNVIDNAGNQYQACTRSWDNNKELDASDRGVAWGFEYNDVRIYLLNGQGDGGSGFADGSVGYWINENGNPSEELVGDPELELGGITSKNVSSWTSLQELYPGEYQVYTTADTTDAPQEGVLEWVWVGGDDWFEMYNTLKEWRLVNETMDVPASPGAGNDFRLFEKRARQALAHNYQLKRGLELSFIDRSSNREIERSPFSNKYFWNSGDWEQNQSGADVAYIVCGGSFNAGTGEVKLTLEDCVTYSRDNLTNKSYSTIGDLNLPMTINS